MFGSYDVGGKHIILVCEANADGVLEALTFFAMNDLKYLNKNVRVGKPVAFSKARKAHAGTTSLPKVMGLRPDPKHH